MNDYAIRCVESDVPNLYALAVALGVLAQADDGWQVAAPYTGAWDVIGRIERPTGNLQLVGDLSAGTQELVPEMAPSADESGEPYWHANLRIDASLNELAQASTIPQVQAGLSDIGRWFVLGSDGLVGLPAQPARVWL